MHLTQANTVDSLKKAIEGRLHALANAHSLLAQWAGADLRTIVAEGLAPFCQGSETRVRLNGPNLKLEPDMAQSMALVLHELTTNALKYGALSVPMGQVQVEWSQAADGQFIFRWAESGGPAVKLPSHRGFGTTVIEHIKQLNGEVRCDWRREGLACEITAHPSNWRDLALTFLRFGGHWIKRLGALPVRG